MKEAKKYRHSGEREGICNQNTNTPLTNKITDNFLEEIMSCQNLWSYCGWNEVHKHNTPYCTVLQTRTLPHTPEIQNVCITRQKQLLQ